MNDPIYYPSPNQRGGLFCSIVFSKVEKTYTNKWGFSSRKKNIKPYDKTQLPTKKPFKKV